MIVKYLLVGDIAPLRELRTNNFIIDSSKELESVISSILTPEAAVGFSFNLTPGLCLSLLGLMFTVLGIFSQSSPDLSSYKGSVSTSKKICSCTILAIVPIFVLDILSKISKFCNCQHIDPMKLIWFFEEDKLANDDMKMKLKMLNIDITKMFYGQILALVFNVYILLRTPLRSVQITQWISICFGVISLLKVSMSVALFQLEQRKGTAKRSTTKLRYYWTIFKQLLYDMVHFLPLFLTNAAFNILTMDLFLNFCQRSGMVWLAFVYFIPLMCFNLFMLKDIGEIAFLTRYFQIGIFYRVSCLKLSDSTLPGSVCLFSLCLQKAAQRW